MNEQKVVNLGQAVSVLKQAAEMGREKGIYEFDDLDLIIQAIKFVNWLEAESKKAEEQANESNEGELENAPESETPETPEAETKEVVLEPTKD